MFDGDAGIVKVLCGIPGLVVCWRVTCPLGTVLKFLSVKARVDDFFEFLHRFSFYLDRRRRGLYLRGKQVVFVEF